MATPSPPPKPPAPRGLLAMLLPESSPLDLRFLGRALLHAMLVGLVAGGCGVVLFAALEWVQHILLEGLAGFQPLRAAGEQIVGDEKRGPYRPWLLVLLPGVGALLGGLVTAFAPECRGGGGDAMIDAFHKQGGVIRRRVAWVKALASILTLGTGGSGGREGPTMQVGGALGSLVGGALRVSARERRILLVAGVAAGISAVFRTPLGAAILAVEILYRDDFESDALIPAVLASVVAYSVVISVYGESTLFAHAERYPFIPSHLAWYGLLALLICIVAIVFLAVLRGVQRLATKLPGPAWLRPGLGGLLMGALATPIIFVLGRQLDVEGQGFGLFGGGYGAAQAAITGGTWLPTGWLGVQILLALCAAKLVASSFTIGSGGSAGDFAPSLVIGGLFGGAFGRAVELLSNDPRIDPGAFALVGMGTFYGGLAHTPLSALVLTCELAGSYDLLVPLMLSVGVAFVALRRRYLYPAQVPTRRDSPAHREGMIADVLAQKRVRDVMVQGRPFIRFEPRTPAREVLARVADANWQDVFPVLDDKGAIRGMVTADGLRVVASETEVHPWTIAADIMQAPVSLKPDDDLREATAAMLKHGVRELPVTDEGGRIIGFLDEAEAARVYLEVTAIG